MERAVLHQQGGHGTTALVQACLHHRALGGAAVSDVRERDGVICHTCSQALEVGSEVVCVDRLVSADDLPAIYCADMFDRRLIGSRPYTMEDLQTPIFDFLHRFCGIDIYMDLTEINAVNADETLSDMLKVPKGTALLHLDERGYTLDGRLVLYSSEYYRNGILNHTILRKKI
jgi:GntR family transcriptional regulator